MRVNISEAKQRLSKLVDSAAKGAEVVILRNGEAVAKLVSVRPRPRRGLRNYGSGKEFWQADSDAAFSPEADAEISRMFGDV